MKTAAVLPILAILLVGCVRFSASHSQSTQETEKTCGCDVTHPSAKALNADGTPLAGVKIFTRIDGPGVTFKLAAKATDPLGVAIVDDASQLIGLAPDGRLAISQQAVLKFGEVGALTLRLIGTDGRGLASRYVALLPSIKPRPFVDVADFIAEEPYYGDLLTRLFSGLTDVTGSIHFRNLPKGAWFSVVTRLPSNKSIGFPGSVQTGESKQIMITNNCEVSGRVVRRDGRPVSGATVKFEYTPYIVGVLDNGPDVLDQAQTDRQGNYRLSHVANCAYEVEVEGPKVAQDSVAAVRIGKGKWRSQTMAPIAPGRTVCDVRVRSR